MLHYCYANRNSCWWIMFMPLWAKKVKKGQGKLQLEELDSSDENPDFVEMINSWTHTPRLLTIFDFQKTKVLPISPYTALQTRQTSFTRRGDGDSFKCDKPKLVLSLTHQLFIPKYLSKTWNSLSNSTRNMSCPHYSLYCRCAFSERRFFMVFQGSGGKANFPLWLKDQSISDPCRKRQSVLNCPWLQRPWCVNECKWLPSQQADGPLDIIFCLGSKNGW